MFRHRRAILKEFQRAERDVWRTLIVHESHTSKKSYTCESNITSILITNIRLISICYNHYVTSNCLMGDIITYISLKVNIVLHIESSIRIIVPKQLKRNYLRENTVRIQMGRSQWSRGNRRGSATTRLLELWVQSRLGYRCLSIVRALCCAGRGRAITRSEESCLARCVQWVWSRRPARGDHDPESGRSATEKHTHTHTCMGHLQRSLVLLSEVCSTWPVDNI